MVTGQAFVLYSRLNLVVRNTRLLRTVRNLIILDGICLHIPTLILLCGVNSPSIGDAWVSRFNIMERIQLMGFCIQESVLSSIYIVATVKLLGVVYQARVREAMVQLLAINFICIGMDMVLIGLEFSNNYVGEASVKPLIYAIKLKLEFAVYKQLMGFTKAAFTDPDNPNSPSDTPDTVNPPHHGGWGIGTNFNGNGGAIPKRKLLALRKPSVPTVPTITTHPEQILKTQRVDIVSEWDSSRTDLNPAAIAAALTCEKVPARLPAPVTGRLQGVRRRSWVGGGDVIMPVESGESGGNGEGRRSRGSEGGPAGRWSVGD